MSPLPPPPPRGPGQAAPKQELDRYLAWLQGQGKSVTGEAMEHIHLRLGDWGFYNHGPAGSPLDRAAIDKSGNTVTTDDKSAWNAFLGQFGLNPSVALQRIAWLFRAQEVEPDSTFQFGQKDKVTAPTLQSNDDGGMTFRGWVVYPPNTNEPMRITIVTSDDKTTITHESANKL